MCSHTRARLGVQGGVHAGGLCKGGVCLVRACKMWGVMLRARKGADGGVLSACGHACAHVCACARRARRRLWELSFPLPSTDTGGDTPQDTAPGRVAHGDAVGAGVYEPK